jgi:N-acyl-D-amino-acid deacylase
MHPHPWVNLYYLVGNCVLRHAAGSLDRYSPSSPGQIAAMRGMLAESLEMGAMGVSLGLEYEPGASYEEIDALASVASEWDAFISTHIRYDDDRCVDAVREVISISRKWNVRVQVSHLGSMTFFHTAECADMIASAREEGARVTFDCYPYDAFCTNIGSAVFDDGFEDRWRGKGPEYLEAISGKFKGRRLDRATFAEMRRNEPDRLVVAYIMNEDEVEACIAHPDCVVASDTFYDGEGIHPRTSGTFPRALGMLRRRGYSWGDALRKVTAMPADALGLKSGRLLKGAAADIVVFDPENFKDMATYQNPFEPPTGVKLVFVGGKLTLENGEIKSGPHGAFRRSGLTAKSRPSC